MQWEWYFHLAAVLGFKKYMCLVAVGIAGYGVSDFLQHLFIQNPGVQILVARLLCYRRSDSRRLVAVLLLKERAQPAN